MKHPAIAQIYVNLIVEGDKMLDQVPSNIREDVEALWYEQQVTNTSPTNPDDDLGMEGGSQNG